jgi:hypothetical protein
MPQLVASFWLNLESKIEINLMQCNAFDACLDANEWNVCTCQAKIFFIVGYIMSSTFQIKVVLLLSQALSWNHPFTLGSQWNHPFALGSRWNHPFTMGSRWNHPFTLGSRWNHPFTMGSRPQLVVVSGLSVGIPFTVGFRLQLVVVSSLSVGIPFTVGFRPSQSLWLSSSLFLETFLSLL